MGLMFSFYNECVQGFVCVGRQLYLISWIRGSVDLYLQDWQFVRTFSRLLEQGSGVFFVREERCPQVVWENTLQPFCLRTYEGNKIVFLLVSRKCTVTILLCGILSWVMILEHVHASC